MQRTKKWVLGGSLFGLLFGAATFAADRWLLNGTLLKTFLSTSWSALSISMMLQIGAVFLGITTVGFGLIAGFSAWATSNRKEVQPSDQCSKQLNSSKPDNHLIDQPEQTASTPLHQNPSSAASAPAATASSAAPLSPSSQSEPLAHTSSDDSASNIPDGHTLSSSHAPSTSVSPASSQEPSNVTPSPLPEEADSNLNVPPSDESQAISNNRNKITQTKSLLEDACDMLSFFKNGPDNVQEKIKELVKTQAVGHENVTGFDGMVGDLVNRVFQSSTTYQAVLNDLIDSPLLKNDQDVLNNQDCISFLGTEEQFNLLRNHENFQFFKAALDAVSQDDEEENSKEVQSQEKGQSQESQATLIEDFSHNLASSSKTLNSDSDNAHQTTPEQVHNDTEDSSQNQTQTQLLSRANAVATQSTPKPKKTEPKLPSLLSMAFVWLDTIKNSTDKKLNVDRVLQQTINYGLFILGKSGPENEDSTLSDQLKTFSQKLLSGTFQSVSELQTAFNALIPSGSTSLSDQQVSEALGSQDEWRAILDDNLSETRKLFDAQEASSSVVVPR